MADEQDIAGVLRLASRVTGLQCDLWESGADDRPSASLEEALAAFHEELRELPSLVEAAARNQEVVSVLWREVAPVQLAEKLHRISQHILEELFIDTHTAVLKASASSFLASSIVQMLCSLHGVLSGLPQAAKNSVGLNKQGGTIMFFVVQAAVRQLDGAGEELSASIFSLLTVIGDELLGKKWGIEDPWGDGSHPVFWGESLSPLVSSAESGHLALVSLVHDKAKKANVSEAAVRAFKKGFREVFSFLLQNQRCLVNSVTGSPLPRSLAWDIRWIDDPIKADSRFAMLRELFIKWPKTVESRFPVDELGRASVLDVAIYFGNLRLFELALECGAKISYELKRSAAKANEVDEWPTLPLAFRHARVDMMKVLVERHGALDDWVHRYSDEAKGGIAEVFSMFALRRYPTGQLGGDAFEAFEGVDEDDANEAFDYMLSKGWNWPWTLTAVEGLGGNLVLNALFGGELLREHNDDGILMLLQKLHSRSMDVLHAQKYLAVAAAAGGKEQNNTLPTTAVHLCATVGLPKTMAWAIEQLGPASVNEVCESDGEDQICRYATPLTQAILAGDKATALLLLDTYKAEAAPLTLSGLEQPICCALRAFDREEDALLMVQRLVAADPLLCTLDCYQDPRQLNPVDQCVNRGLRKCLEYLLTSKVAGIEALCKNPCVYPIPADAPMRQMGEFLESRPTDDAAARKDWEMVSLLLKYVPTVPVTRRGRILSRDGKPTVATLSSVSEIVDLEYKKGGPNAPPRSLVLQLNAMAAREMETKERGGSKGKRDDGRASSAPEGAFEDPEVHFVTSEKEEKKRAKRREQKKKAKAKKKAAAKVVAHAGAGKEADAASSSEDDSSGGEDETEGMDEEERMLARAPTFDLEKEKAARKARALEEEAEAAKKDKKAAEAKGSKGAEGDEVFKPCDLCSKRCPLLYRCQIDASRAWRFVCPACWPRVSGGVTDGNKETHPYYRYGGTWKYFKR
jgi:hypothetical protein